MNAKFLLIAVALFQASLAFPAGDTDDATTEMNPIWKGVDTLKTLLRDTLEKIADKTKQGAEKVKELGQKGAQLAEDYWKLFIENTLEGLKVASNRLTDALENAKNYAKSLPGPTKQKVIEVSASLEKKLNEAKMKASELMDKVKTSGAIKVEKAKETIKAVLDKINTEIDQYKKIVDDLLKKHSGPVKENLKLVLTKVNNVVDNLADKTKQGAEKVKELGQKGAQLAQNYWKLFIENTLEVFNAASNKVKGALEDAKNYAKSLQGPTKQKVLEVAASLEQKLNEAKMKASELMDKVKTSGGIKMEQAKETLKAVLGKISTEINEYKTTVEGILQKQNGIAKENLKIVLDKVNEVVDKLAEKINQGAEKVKELGQKGVQTADEYWKSFISNAIEGLNNASNKLKGALESIHKYAKNLAGPTKQKVLEVAATLEKKLNEAKMKASELMDKVKTSGAIKMEQAKETLKDMLDKLNTQIDEYKTIVDDLLQKHSATIGDKLKMLFTKVTDVIGKYTG